LELLEFCSEDPKSKKNCRKGHMDFDFGQFWMKGQNCHGTGKYKSIQPSAFYINSVGAKPSLIVSHELSLNEAPDATNIMMPVKRMDENNPKP
jgi:hypothetical protein